MASTTNLKVDVLVVGGGAAGAAAALSSAESGAETAILCKAALGKSTATCVSGGGFTFEDQYLTATDYLKRIREIGHFMNDSRLARAMTRNSREVILDFFSKHRLPIIHADSPRRRGYYRVPREDQSCGGGKLALEMARAVRQSKTTVLEKVFCDALLVDAEGRCVGAAAISQNGDLYVIEAKSTIICAGGCSAMFTRCGAPASLVGDGLAMAYEIGAELRDMEFHQFYPLGLFEEGLPPLPLFPPFPEGIAVVNGRGEDLIEKYLGQGISVYRAAVVHRDQLSCAIEREHRMGAGAGLSFVGMTGEGETVAGGGCVIQLKELGLPLRERPLKVRPLAHTSLGGITIDEDGSTAVAGLFAAGESAGGIHGANRSGGAALAECIIFGVEAGKTAARKASEAGTTTAAGKVGDDWRAKLQERMDSSAHAGAIEEIEAKVQAAADNSCGILREEKGLKRGLSEIEEARRQLSTIKAGDLRGYRKLRETESMALCCEISLRAALLREESRGCQLREDRPQTSEAMGKKRTAVKKAGGKVSAFLVDLV